MFDLKKTENGIEIKNSNSMPIILFMCIFLVIMLLVVIMAGIASNKPIGLIEILFFVFLIVFLTIYAYVDSTKKLTVNNNGVTFKSALKSEYISWADVNDYGVSYCGRGRYGTCYYLYFSKEKQNKKNEYSKKFKGGTIKFLFDGKQYKTITDNLIPYCIEKISITPFIGKEK